MRIIKLEQGLILSHFIQKVSMHRLLFIVRSEKEKEIFSVDAILGDNFKH